MAYDPGRRSSSPPEYWGSPRDPSAVSEHARKIAQSTRELLDGLLNNHYSVTLEAGETETSVPFKPSRTGASVLLTPCNQAAAQFQRTTDVWVEAENENVKVHHDASATGAEVFSLAVFG